MSRTSLLLDEVLVSWNMTLRTTTLAKFPTFWLQIDTRFMQTKNTLIQLTHGDEESDPHTTSSIPHHQALLGDQRSPPQLYGRIIHLCQFHLND